MSGNLGGQNQYMDTRQLKLDNIDIFREEKRLEKKVFKTHRKHM
jgi:hypothetical protein